MKIKELLQEMYIFSKIIKLNWFFFLIPLSLSILIAFLDVLSIALLAPLAKGVIEQDFSFIYENDYVISFFNFFSINLEGNQIIFIILVSIILISFLLKNILIYVNNLIIEIYMQKILHKTRSKIFENFLNTGKTYFDNQNIGYLQKIILSHSKDLVDFFRKTMNAISKIILVFFYVTLLIYISVVLTILTIIILFCMKFFLSIIISKIKKSSPHLYKSQKHITEYTQNMISIIPLIKTQNMEDLEKNNFIYKSENLSNWRISIAKKSLLIPPLQQLINISTILILISITAFILFKIPNSPSVYAFGIFFLILKRGLPLTDFFYQYLSDIAEKMPIYLDVIQTTYLPQKYVITSGTKKLDTFKTEIHFDTVSFKYTDTTILNKLTLTIKKGSKVAIVGKSGQGKTTILNLLLRVYQIQNGKILLDGTSIYEYTSESYYKHFAYVSQDIGLFNDTLYKNISYGISNCTMKDILNACEKAKLINFIHSLPSGLETIIGDRGIKLSGGEKQRVSIARAILKKASILVLDEATSSLDSDTERDISENLYNVLKDKTAIIVAHRLSTIKNADNILVLDAGKIIETGSMNELIQKKGHFFNLWKSQQFK